MRQCETVRQCDVTGGVEVLKSGTDFRDITARTLASQQSFSGAEPEADQATLLSKAKQGNHGAPYNWFL